MKDKNTAALYALFLGWFGVHRFYLRQPGLGILYILLVGTGISVVLGIIDAIVLFSMDPEEFDRRYNDEDGEGSFEHDRYRRYRRERSDYRRKAEGAETRRERSSSSHARRSRSSRQRPTRRSGTRQRQTQRKRVNPYKQSGIKKYKDFDLEAAIEDFKKGLEIDPNDISLNFNIACAYSLTEKVDLAYQHLSKAVENGFKDFEKIKTHDDLAYVRIQPRFEEFEKNGFRIGGQLQLDAPKEDLLSDDILLSQLKRLSELKEKGLITEKEFDIEKRKLMG